MEQAIVLQSRRYNAAIIRHSAFEGDRMFRFRTWASITGDSLAKSEDVRSWRVCQASHLTKTNFYSQAAVPEHQLSVESGYVQGLFLLVPPHGWLGNAPCIVAAAPYIRLLHRVLVDLEFALGSPRPRYVRPRMSETFVGLATAPDSYVRVSQFSVNQRKEPRVDRVSIAGRNPLGSQMGRVFASQGIPYDIRIQRKNPGSFATNVNLDRHGNLWWYHRGEASFANTLAVLDLLEQMNLFDFTPVIPTSKKDVEND